MPQLALLAPPSLAPGVSRGSNPGGASSFRGEALPSPVLLRSGLWNIEAADGNRSAKGKMGGRKKKASS